MGVLRHNLSIDDAFELVKDAINGKFAVLSEKDNYLKVGSPMMTATIIVTESEISVSGKGAGKIVANTCESSISSALKKYCKVQSNENNKNISNNNENLDVQIKTAKLLKSIKELYDLGIMSEDEYNQKKESLLKIIVDNNFESSINVEYPIVGDDAAALDNKEHMNSYVNNLNESTEIKKDKTNTNDLENQNDVGYNLDKKERIYKGCVFHGEIQSELDYDYVKKCIDNLKKIKDYKDSSELITKYETIIYEYDDRINRYQIKKE